MASKTYVLKGNLSHGSYALPNGDVVEMDGTGSYSTAKEEHQRLLETDPASPFKLEDKKGEK
jgi:hypothetical protein